jgi:hypothetical protein
MGVMSQGQLLSAAAFKQVSRAICQAGQHRLTHVIDLCGEGRTSLRRGPANDQGGNTDGDGAGPCLKVCR